MHKVILIALFATLIFSGCAIPSTPQFSKRHSPSIIHNFIELDKIARVSKFRSGYGHDFSYAGDETCRSMKHYFDVLDGVDPRTVRYFAPVNGTIVDMRETINEFDIVESQFSIRSDENSAYYFLFFHVLRDANMQQGSHVAAGQFIGTIGHPNAHGEIAVEERSGGGVLHSWFDVIDTELSHDYAERGVNKENIIIKKEVRDADPLACDFNTPDGRFVPRSGENLTEFQEWQNGEENWIILK